MNQGNCPKCSQPNAYTKIICDFCGARLPWADAVAPAGSTTPSPSPIKKSIDPPGFNGAALKRSGRLSIILGVAGLIYFMLFFDTSVSAGGFGRVNNIGLMAERQNYMMFSMGAIILGVILMGIEYLKSNE